MCEFYFSGLPLHLRQKKRVYYIFLLLFLTNNFLYYYSIFLILFMEGIYNSSIYNNKFNNNILFWPKIRLAADRGWNRVIFESDSYILLQSLSSHQYGESEFYAIVFSIIAQLSLHFNFKVMFIRRQANKVAHTLVRVVCSWVSYRILYVYPSCIEQCLINDIS